MNEVKQFSESEKSSKEARLFHNSGLVLYEKKNYNEAIYHFQKVLTLVNDEARINDWTYLYLGNAYRDSGDNDEARHYYTLALETESGRIKSRVEEALSKM